MGSIVYLLLCLIVGFFGRRRVLRFWGTFFLAVAGTPIVAAIILIAGAELSERRARAQ